MGVDKVGGPTVKTSDRHGLREGGDRRAGRLLTLGPPARAVDRQFDFGQC